MLYDPLSHLSGLYGAAIDSLKTQPRYPELVALGESVLRSLGQAYEWDDAHRDISAQKAFVKDAKQFIKRLEKVLRSLTMWVDDRQYVSLIISFEQRWAGLLENAEEGRDEKLDRLINESEYRRETLGRIMAEIDAEDQDLKGRYGIPTAL